ncbi:Hsp20/alpha crystallin family protein [Candidatus Uhrbacteria bacterium]|nr:Hsp20/alpha crystallin family protein [Candidatus Uhrbacteria bacterium]
MASSDTPLDFLFPPAAKIAESSSNDGELLIDMYERDDALVIRSFVAGLEPDHLDISLDGDILTIRGSRAELEEIHDDRFFHRECYWGSFSRSVMIPGEIDRSRIRALFKNGVVYIELPKSA